MNTLVDHGNGAPRVPEAKDATASVDDALLHPTLVELAPESGGTLVLPPDAAHDVRVGWTHGMPAGAPTLVSPRSRDQIRGYPPTLVSGPEGNHHLKRWAPIAVGIASLCATAIPLSLLTPRPAAVGAADRQAAARVESRSGPPAPADPPDPIGAPEEIAPGPALERVARAAGPRRAHARGGVGSRAQGRAPVMRTRNGAPVVE